MVLVKQCCLPTRILSDSSFGSGALLCAPLSEWLFTKYRQVPEFLGNKSDVNLVQEGGRLLTDVQGQLKEVVVATSETLSTMPGLVENGVYLAGTGSTGVGPTFLTLSALYVTHRCVVLSPGDLICAGTQVHWCNADRSSQSEASEV